MRSHTSVTTHNQTDIYRETLNKCLTTHTHTDKTDTPRHSLSWPRLLMTITAPQHSTPSLYGFLSPSSTIVRALLTNIKMGMIVTDNVEAQREPFVLSVA